MSFVSISLEAGTNKLTTIKTGNSCKMQRGYARTNVDLIQKVRVYKAVPFG